MKNTILLITLGSLSACNAGELAVSGGLGLATVYAGTRPTNELEQTYYLGIFDPDEQVPPEVYRVRIHGQSSMLSSTKFASGWVPANMIDSLGTQYSFAQEDGGLGELNGQTKDSLKNSLKLGKRQIMFGPEGFMESPRDHRLVVVMGSSPDAFFSAIDETLGAISGADAELRQSALRKKILEALFLIRSEQLRLADLDKKQERGQATQ